MDENSREGETSENAENPVDGEKPNKIEDDSEFFKRKRVVIDFGGGSSGNQVSDRCGSSFDASEIPSGPSNDFPPPNYGNESIHLSEDTNEQQEDANVVTQVPSSENQTEYQHHVRMAPDVVDPGTRKPSLGPPPSYSFVMKQKRKAPKPPTSDSDVTTRPPPPNYCGVRGLYMTPEDERLERICNLPSFSEPIWRSHSQPALCPRCGILVLTTTHSHDSIATHVAALTLCLFGCWPCCLLPYCMNICKNTYHHCPICQCFLGAYTPW